MHDLVEAGVVGYAQGAFIVLGELVVGFAGVVDTAEAPEAAELVGEGFFVEGVAFYDGFCDLEGELELVGVVVFLDRKSVV